MISISGIAERILLGGAIEDKLFGAKLASTEIDWEAGGKLISSQQFELGRTGKLAPRTGEEESFPKFSELKNQSARGKLLHYFANHELLAMETMALTLLKFPTAPVEFKQGVFKTLQDEQRHFQAYQKRMHDYGVEVGDFPLNLYFWNTLKTIESPMDFVVRMSMTFEQANLDFALEFARQMENLGDEECAKILRVVHDDEVKHVQHGLKWFNTWRDHRQESEWESYKKHLPFPMTPRRAKGKWFSEQSRIDAGFSKEYIEELKIAGGSRGRAPDYYFFNPQCELEPRDLTPAATQKVNDLAPLVLWLAKESDLVEMAQKPPREWLAELHEMKGELPEIVTPSEIEKYAYFEQFKPWGWSESAWKRFSDLKEKVRTKAAIQISNERTFPWLSKGWWSEKIAQHDVLRAFIPPKVIVRNKNDLESILADGSTQYILKPARGLSGRGHQIVSCLEDVKISGNEEYVVEKYLNKVADFSTQFEVLPSGELKIFEPRFFKNTEKFQYQGAYLGSGVREEIPARYWDGVKRSGELRMKVIQSVAEILKAQNYFGPVGIDSLLHEENGELKVQPLLEVNARLTMGRIAIEIESSLRKKGLSTDRFWSFFTSQSLKHYGAKNFLELELILKKMHPELMSTTPAKASKDTWTALL